LGIVAVAKAGILALRREGEEEVAPAGQAGGLEDRLEHLGGGAGIGGRFEHDQLARAQPRGDRAGGGLDIGQVGLAVAGERGRHADQERVGLGQAGEVGGGGQPSLRHRRRDLRARDVLDVALAAVEPRHIGRVDVEAEHGEAGPRGGQRQRQPDIAQPDDANPRLPRLKPRQKRANTRGRRGKAYIISRHRGLRRRTWRRPGPVPRSAPSTATSL